MGWVSTQEDVQERHDDAAVNQSDSASDMFSFRKNPDSDKLTRCNYCRTLVYKELFAHHTEDICRKYQAQIKINQAKNTEQNYSWKDTIAEPWLTQAIKQSKSKKGWVSVSDVAKWLRKNRPNFISRYCRSNDLPLLLKEFPNSFEVDP